MNSVFKILSSFSLFIRNDGRGNNLLTHFPAATLEIARPVLGETYNKSLFFPVTAHLFNVNPYPSCSKNPISHLT